MIVSLNSTLKRDEVQSSSGEDTNCRKDGGSGAGSSDTWDERRKGLHVISG